MTATVLVCDDEEVMRALVCAILADERYETVEARDGDESLEIARSVRPDLVVLDMMMPGRSGLEVLGELRADPELAETAVVMLTARTQAADRAAVAEAGADRYLPKPFSPAELLSLVEELLAR